MYSRGEQQVVDQLILGLSNAEIATRIFVCEKTVKFHLTNIFKKANVKSRTEFLAQRTGSSIQRGDYMKEINTPTVLPSVQGKLATQVGSKSQEDKITFIDEKFRVGETIGQLHGMMKEVTKDEITPNTVNAACNCVARLNETINTAIQAARFLNER